MKKITVRFKQKMEFYQEIEITDEQYEILKAVDGEDIYPPRSWGSDEPVPAYDIITSAIDYTSVLDSDEIESFEIIE